MEYRVLCNDRSMVVNGLYSLDVVVVSEDVAGREGSEAIGKAEE